MDYRITYIADVLGGRLKIIRRKEFDHAVSQFEGKQIEITIQVKRKRRSLMQNAYYYGVIVPMVQVGLNDAGYKLGKEQAHDFIKSQFAIKEIVNEQTGDPYYVKSMMGHRDIKTSLIYVKDTPEQIEEYALYIQICKQMQQSLNPKP